MPLPTTPAEFARWQFDNQLLENLLARSEQAERAMLTTLGCSVDLPTVYNILAGTVPPPWKGNKKIARRDKPKILHAMHTLVLIEQARRYVHLGEGNAPLAAHAAFLAGLHATSARLHIAKRESQREGQVAGGVERGRAKATKAQQHDAAILKAVRQWSQSEDLQFEGPMAAYIAKRTKRKLRTVQNRLKALRVDTSRK